MALQGTLDTFELPDVLRLLSSTRKTGRLRLESDRGTGDVWLTDGGVVGVATGDSPADDVAAGVFELLRAREGAFVFEPGESPAQPLAPSDVEALLGVAEERLREWRSIEAVVPSLAAWVGLAPEIPAPQVTLDADTWRLIATIAGGLTVGELGHVLGLGEVEVSRLVRDLVELGVGAVGPAPVAAHEPAHIAPEPLAEGFVTDAPVAPLFEPAPVLTSRSTDEPAESYEPTPAFDTPAVYEPAPVFDVPSADRGPLFGSPEPSDETPILSSLTPAEWDEPAAPAPAIDDDEVARQLAMLSPRAAEAIAAAAGGSEEARQAALAAVEAEADAGDEDEPINRGLLLKFLSSVKS